VEKSREGECGAPDALDACAEAAVAGVCRVEPNTAENCQAIVQRCSRWRDSRLTVRQCQAALTAVKPRYRDNAVTCISEGCRLSYCLLQLAWAADHE
jgi:hypothetical protein